MTIIKPQSTSTDLEQLRDNVIEAMGFKTYERTRIINGICNFLMSGILWAIFVLLLSYVTRHLVAHNPTWLMGGAILCEMLVLPFCLFSLENFAKGWTNPLVQWVVNRTDSKWESVCEKGFLSVICEAERIEDFYKILEAHPDCVIHKTDDGGVIAEYVDDNFSMKNSFLPDSNLMTSTSNFAKNNKLDFSYLDKAVQVYTGNPEEAEVCNG